MNNIFQCSNCQAQLTPILSMNYNIPYAQFSPPFQFLPAQQFYPPHFQSFIKNKVIPENNLINKEESKNFSAKKVHQNSRRYCLGAPIPEINFIFSFPVSILCNYIQPE